MDYETISPENFGASLRGMGVNILVRDVLSECTFLETVFELSSFQKTPDFAILTYGKQVFQLHSDSTYANHPLLNLLPELPPRGAGIELRLYDSDPDAAVARAKALKAMILHEPTDKPHGLREATILCANGYAWVPSRPLVSTKNRQT